jgi:hypothetical protein
MTWNFGKGEFTFTVPDTTTITTYGFATRGTKNVCLTVFSDTLQSTTCKYVKVTNEADVNCQSKFIYTIDTATNELKCLNQSLGNNLNYSWIILDSVNVKYQTSVADPNYTLPDGYYKVKLGVDNIDGCKHKSYQLIKIGTDSIGIQGQFGWDLDSSNKKASGYPVDFVAISHGDAAKLKWSFGDGEYDSTTTNPTHQYASTGIYTACLEIWDQITGDYDIYCEEINVTGPQSVYENNIVLLKDIIIHPNPADEYTNISYNLTNEALVTITLTSIDGSSTGREIAVLKPAGDHTTTLETTGLPKGAYFITVIIDGTTITRPIIVQ